MNSFAMGGQNGHQYIPRGQPIPQGIRWQSATPTGANTSAWASWTSPAGQTGNYKFPVAVGSATLGTAFKSSIKKLVPIAGWYMTAKSILEGLGWAINELQGQVVAPGTPQADLANTVFCLSKGGEYYCANSPGQLLHIVESIMILETQRTPCGTAGLYTNGGMRYWCTRKSDGAQLNSYLENPLTRPASGWPATHHNSNPGSEDQPISDYDLGQVLKQHPEIVNAVLIDPNTGAPIRTPELIAALNTLMRQLEAANGVTTPQPDLVTDSDWGDQEPPNQTDWPGFCDWATVVCEFINWFKLDPQLPDDVELPYEEKEIEWQERDSGLGAGTCPAPISASVLDTTVEFGYEGICGFMEYMRPVAIACAWISAAFIVVNARPMRF
ncbi:virulence factor TspB C-terminal domain-related protein [Pseudoxanthomonas sp. LjRoot168]|uniref:virulence factor TspB C-terminal domain-related protein n=1 Tax=unclassified Pseudoxanthomonas TaxID=2645906 RepID=UPI003ECDD6B1